MSDMGRKRVYNKYLSRWKFYNFPTNCTLSSKGRKSRTAGTRMLQEFSTRTEPL